MMAEHKKMTIKNKLERCIRALRAYGNTDMWHHGNGIPNINGIPYGLQCTCSHTHCKTNDIHSPQCARHSDNKGDCIYYNAFGINPAQNGWELADDTLKEIGEKNV